MDCLLASILVDFCGFWIDFGSLFWLIFEGQLVRKGNQNDERCQGQNSLPKERPGRRVRLRTPPSPRGSAGIFRFPGALGEGKGGGNRSCSNTPHDPGGVGGLITILMVIMK